MNAPAKLPVAERAQLRWRKPDGVARSTVAGMKKRADIQRWGGIGCWLAALLLAGWAQAATTLDISPKGTLPDDRAVRLVVTATFDPGATLEDFALLYGGVDITRPFLESATVTRPDSRTLVASVEYLFPPGSHALSARIKAANEVTVTASANFQVPEGEQVRLRNALLANINGYLHLYDSYQFSRVISLGVIERFTLRANDPSFQIYLNPELLTNRGAVASYMELFVYLQPAAFYFRDLVLKMEPSQFVIGPTPDLHPIVLWHEMVHALSDTANQTGIDRLPAPRAGLTLEQIDHFYTDWAESCAVDGVLRLKAFEDHAAKQPPGTPSANAIAVAREHWRGVVNECNRSNNPLGVPDTAQRAVFKNLVGFDVDVNRVKQHYLGLGYPAAYFDAAVVTITSPGPSSTVSSADVQVTATVNRVPGTAIGLAGFVANGVVRLVTPSGDTFTDRIPLQTGTNTIVAGIVPRAAPGMVEEPVISAPITVTRQAAACPQVTTWTNTDQSLYAPLRITRVDHANSPGLYYFYVWNGPGSQEKTIRGTYFSLRATPSLTRDQTFANNVGVSLVSFASAGDANTVWQREMAAWDALLPSMRPDLIARTPTRLVWGGAAVDGTKSIESLSLVQGSVIAYHSLRSSAAAETVEQAGVAGLVDREGTTFGLVAVRCGGH